MSQRGPASPDTGISDAGCRGSVLVGVPGEQSSEDLVAAAQDVARRLGAPLHLLHAVTGDGGREPDGGALMDAGRMSVLAGLEAAGLGHLGTRLLVQAGEPARVLATMARRHGAALLMLGAGRQRGVLDDQGVLARLLPRVGCPVWVQAGSHRPVERILAPVDLSPGSQRALSWAATLARPLDAKLDVLHCHTEPRVPVSTAPEAASTADRGRAQEVLQVLCQELRAPGLEVGHRFVEGRPVPVILSERLRYDLVVMATNNGESVTATGLGTVAQDVVVLSRGGTVLVPALDGPAGGEG